MGTYFKMLDKQTDRIRLIPTNERLFDYIYPLVEYEEDTNGVPIAIEIDCWGEIACIGDYFKTPRFEIELIER